MKKKHRKNDRNNLLQCICKLKDSNMKIKSHDNYSRNKFKITNKQS